MPWTWCRRGSGGRTGRRRKRIGLVAAVRPADVLLVIGWAGLVNSGESLLELTAVLRSWEDRFGARVIDGGYADLRVFVERPRASWRSPSASRPSRWCSPEIAS